MTSASFYIRPGCGRDRLEERGCWSGSLRLRDTMLRRFIRESKGVTAIEYDLEPRRSRRLRDEGLGNQFTSTSNNTPTKTSSSGA